VLVDEGLLKEDQVQDALRRQRATGESFGEILVSMGFVTELDIARTLVKQSGLPFIDASKYRINKDGIAAVPPEMMWLNQLVVVDKIGKTLLVAIANVISPEILDKLERTSGSQIFVYVSTWSQVQAALEKNVQINGAVPAKAAPAKPGAAKPGAPAAARPGAPAAATAVRPAGNPPSSSSSMPAARPASNPPSTSSMPAVRPASNPPSGT